MYDQNNVKVGLASNGTTAVPLKVSSVDGSLLIHCVRSTATVAVSGNAKRDANNVTCSMAVNELGDIAPLTLNHNNGYLSVKFI